MGFLAEALDGGFVGGVEDPAHGLVLVVLVGLVNRNAAEIFG